MTMALDTTDVRFMDELFADLDASHFSIPPSQSPPKVKQARQHKTSPTRNTIVRARSPLRETTLFQSQPKVERDLEDWFRKPAARQEAAPSRCSISSPGLKRQKVDHGIGSTGSRASTAKGSMTLTRRETGLCRIQEREECTYTRCRVVAVVEGSYEVALDGPGPSNRTRPEKLLVLEIDKHSKSHKHIADTAETILAALRDDWMQTIVSVGSIVHLVGDFEHDTRKIPIEIDQLSKTADASVQVLMPRPKVEVAIEPSQDLASHADGAKVEHADDDDDDLWDDLASMPSLSQCATQELLASDDAPRAKIMIFASRSSTSSRDTDNADHALDNLLVVHPDVLVPATKVADVASCIRKPVVQDRLRGASDVTISLVMGNMLHELLQACLTATSPSSTSESGSMGASVKDEATNDTSPTSPWPERWQGIGDFSRSFVESQVQEQVRANIESLYAIELSADEAATQLREKAAPFVHFARTFLDQEEGAAFHPEATLRESSRTASASIQAKVRVKRVLDVEEDIWSPAFGLKGKVDVSVECDILEPGEMPSTKPGRSHQNQAFAPCNPQSPTNEVHDRRMTTSVVPLELKTGRAEVVSTEHRAQTMLYTLMMSDRYGVKVRDGLLYYSKSGELHRISRSRNEVRSLIIGRNELAHYLRHDASRLRRPKLEEPTSQPEQVLPPTIDSEFKCRRCYAVDGCMLFRRATENVIEPKDVESDAPPNKTGNLLAKRSPIADVYEQKTEHLTDVHLDFFRKWDRLLNLEEEDAVRFRREMWTMTAEQREKVGRCFANMRLDVLSSGDAGEGSSTMRRVVYRFVRHVDPTQDAESGLLSGHITVNDPVTISIEPEMLSVAQGFAVNLTPTAVEIGLDHSLDAAMRRALEKREQPFETMSAVERLVFRIDKDELGSGMGRVRANLAALFLTPQRGGDVKRRELVVEMRQPRFLRPEHDEEASVGVPQLKMSLRAMIDQMRVDPSLNEDQKLAIDKVLSAQDYALVLGMPGTGKTTTIAKLIELLVRLGKRILLTSYTHSAVDTILRKIAEDRATKKEIEDGMRILRLGSKDKVHPDARQFLLPRCSTLEELKDAFESPNVVAATCLSVHHTFFSSGMAKKLRSRTSSDESPAAPEYLFDYCIVDEASQIPLPTCLGPLRFADKFVLVGDHHQLPPLVKNAEAKAGGLDVSLFKLLSDRWGDTAVVKLRSQYRMNDDIMRLSNHLVYGGELRAGSEAVRDRALLLPQLQAALERAGKEAWIEDLLQPTSKVRFLDTSQRSLQEVGESKHGELVKNHFEAEMVIRIATALVAGGCSPSQIAVVTPYRQQIKLLRSLLLAHPELEELELLTADQSQGRDKDVVLVTFTRANYSPSTKDGQEGKDGGGNTGELLNDLRRLNVTLTRAKRKLVMVGHVDTLRGSGTLRPLLELVEMQGWVRRV